jgi:transcriptional regulator with XRE-family HTH domain
MIETHDTNSFDTLEKFRQNFGHRVAVIRKEQGMTQEQLARAMKVDPVFVAFLEGAKRNPSFGTLYKLAKALEVHPKELFRF